MLHYIRTVETMSHRFEIDTRTSGSSRRCHTLPCALYSTIQFSKFIVCVVHSAHRTEHWTIGSGILWCECVYRWQRMRWNSLILLWIISNGTPTILSVFFFIIIFILFVAVCRMRREARFQNDCCSEMKTAKMLRLWNHQALFLLC